MWVFFASRERLKHRSILFTSQDVCIFDIQTFAPWERFLIHWQRCGKLFHKKKKTVKYTQEVSLVAFGIPFFAHLADGFFGIWLFNAYTHKMRIDSENPVFEACFLCPFFLIKNWRRAVVHFGWWILSFDRETSSPISQRNSLIHCDSYFTSLAVYLRETDFFFFFNKIGIWAAKTFSTIILSKYMLIFCAEHSMFHRWRNGIFP